MPRRNSRNPIRGFQALENRQMMAGDVSVTTSSSGSTFDLHIDGDFRSNQISVWESNGIVHVQGETGTTVNGLSSAQIPLTSMGKQRQTLEDIHIDMEGGNDEVVLSGLYTNWDDADIDIDLGDGSDTVRFYNVGAIDDLMIEGGNDWGADSILLWNVGADDIEIETGNGNDAVHGYMVRAIDEFHIETGRGNDTVGFFRARADELDINLGADNDSLTLQEVNANDVDLDGGSGFDQLRFQPQSPLPEWTMNFNPLDEADDFEFFEQL
ncbi:hypothetical protein [Allorhodopirellula heiligendammensis]|uniref:Uncharacterized protein n=1 Tax=Allorhodopirellula heiligendammensis TaxID=2714739 RepID=A0A5C6BVS3_9BACT|nr:hypothetical protein [Allorhodopirellula heiligendammensis]TWU16135.1 hypothetical protein Poly21_33400 [Allorhodopirellula heiligendammensis]